MKKLLLLCMIIALVFSMSTVAFGADAPSAWATEEVNAAIKAGIVPAHVQKNYTSPISREHTAEMIVSLIEKYTDQSIEKFMDSEGVVINPDIFTDTKNEAVLAANAFGIVNGMGDGTFGPNGTLTRAQMAAMANRTAELFGESTKGCSHNFTDTKGHWIDPELGWPSSVGIINGVSYYKFNPDGKLTCEQAIAMVYRLWRVLNGETLTPPPSSYHIGIATLSYMAEEEFRGVEALIAKYGAADKGGIIKHVVLPGNWDEQEAIAVIAGLANDPLMKAIIVSRGVPGTAAAFQKIKEDAGRNDILLLAAIPQDNPNVISKVANVVVDMDDFARGWYDILRAKEMGAKTFIFMSFPRHMSYEILARRRAIYEEACKDLGLCFVFVNVPDPATEIGAAGAQQVVYELMPDLVNKYGKDAVFFTTNTALHEPIIMRVVELGAMFVAQDDITPLCGYPSALGLDFSDQIGDEWALTQRIEKEIIAKGQSGRMGTWAYSFDYCNTAGLFELAMNMIEGNATGDLQKDIVAAYQSFTPGCKWVARVHSQYDYSWGWGETGKELSNYYFLSMETYIFGQGFTDVLSEPVPEKYYSIK